MMLMSTVKRRWLTPIVGALVIGLALTSPGLAGAGLAGGAAPAAPASGPVGVNGGSTIICYPVIVNGVIVRIICRPVRVLVEFKPPCPPLCGPTFGWRHDPRVLPESTENLINEMIVAGLAGLGDAAAAADPYTRTRLRDQALGVFMSAARYSRYTRLSPQQVGLASTSDNSLDPRPEPWHSWVGAAGEDIAQGMAYLKLAILAPPSAGNPYQRLAAAEFDEAYTEFSQQRVIAG